MLLNACKVRSMNVFTNPSLSFVTGSPERMLLLRPNNYMFLSDGVDFNIPLYKVFIFVVVHLYEGHLLLLYS